MHPASPLDHSQPTPGPNSPSVQDASPVVALRRPQEGVCVGEGRHSHGLPHAELLTRVGRVLQDLNAGRIVADAEILQHERDCRRLSEDCYGRFEDFGNPSDREDAVLWQHRAAQARRSLSEAFRAAREAEILRAIHGGLAG